MPELPEVETIVRDLADMVVGRRIEKARVGLKKLARNGPRHLSGLIENEKINFVQRQGKFIIFGLTQDRYLIVHLKMTGQFLLGEIPAPWPKHVHIVLELDNGQALMYRDMRQFGYFLGLTAAEYHSWQTLTDLGPDPFQIDEDDFANRLTEKRGRIKAVLLNQHFLSGLGNIYVDEALFAAGIHPSQPADKIPRDKAVCLHRQIRAILEKAIELRGSTTRNYVGLKGVGGEYQGQHKVYGKAGQPCPICGQIINKMVAAGRGTHFCPVCQPDNL